MKKTILILITTMFLNVAYAHEDESGLPVAGEYNGKKKSCNLSVSISDYYGTGRQCLVVILNNKKMFPYGRVIVTELSDVNMSQDGKVTLTSISAMEPGGAVAISTDEITLQVDDKNKVESFTVKQLSRGKVESEQICTGLVLN